MISYRWLYFWLEPVSFSASKKIGIPLRTGNRSPDGLTKDSWPSSVTTWRESPLYGLRKRATVSVLLAHTSRRAPGCVRLQALKTKPPAKHIHAKAGFVTSAIGAAEWVSR